VSTNQTSASLKSARTTVRRKAERGAYDAIVVNSILDEGLICHVSVIDGETPLMLPTIYARVDDQIYLHGATANHLLRLLADGASACLAVTLIDELVLARSAFHHSMNYRSVVLFGQGELVADAAEKRMAVDAIVEHVLTGRSAHARPPTPNELRATIVVRIPIVEASAKIRTGPPLDDDDDIALPIWAGVLPISMTTLPGVAAPDLTPGIDAPQNVFRPPQRSERH
jgi:hypothetical protein